MKTFKDFELDEACWKGYKQVGMKKKGGKNVPNCVPEENIEEAPYVAGDMDIVDSIWKEIRDTMYDDKRRNRFEKHWPLVQQLAKYAGFKVTKSSQEKGKSFRYDLKK